MRIFGRWLRRRRRAARLSRADVAARLGVPVATIERLERGDLDISAVDYIRLAAILGFDAGVCFNRLASKARALRAIGKQKTASKNKFGLK